MDLFMKQNFFGARTLQTFFSPSSLSGREAGIRLELHCCRSIPHLHPVFATHHIRTFTLEALFSAGHLLRRKYVLSRTWVQAAHPTTATTSTSSLHCRACILHPLVPGALHSADPSCPCASIRACRCRSFALSG